MHNPVQNPVEENWWSEVAISPIALYLSVKLSISETAQWLSHKFDPTIRCDIYDVVPLHIYLTVQYAMKTWCHIKWQAMFQTDEFNLQ